MKITEVMTNDVRSCPLDATLADAAGLMWHGDCGLVPIIGRRGKLAGVITDRDICMAVTTKNARPCDLRVEEIMSHGVHVCKPEEDAREALEIMSAHRVRRVPVVDEDDALVGIVSMNDLILAARRDKGATPSFEEIMGTMKAICAHPEPALATS